MWIIERTTEFELKGRSAAALGKFDGIHRGHRKLLDCILRQKEQGLSAVVFTFDPSPAVFFGGSEQELLTTREEKRAAFERMGVDVLVEFPLNQETASIAPEDFVEDILVRRLRAKYIAAGMDVSFGDKGAGNFSLLRAMSERLDYEVRIIDKVRLFDREVSSTFVREEIALGHMETAAALLGESYRVQGTVVRGRRLGHEMGMPTVNLIPPQDKLLPPRGVYFSQVHFDGRCLPGLTNIGIKPTVADVPAMGIETYIYGFDQEIYGEEIGVSLLSYKRPERRFDGIEGLKKQIAADIEDGKAYFQRTNEEA